MTAQMVSVIFSGVSLLITTIVAAYIAIIAARVKTQSDVMTTLEENTNSIKDALVKATADAAHAEGKAEGRAAEKAENLEQQQQKIGESHDS